MKKFLRKHPEIILTTFALIFAGALIAAYAWGVKTVVMTVNGVVNAESGTSDKTGFDLQTARSLNLRGLVK